MKCSVCNATLQETSSICPVCGFDNEGGQVEQQPQGEKNEIVEVVLPKAEQPKVYIKKKNGWIKGLAITLAVLLFLTAAGFLIWRSTLNTPQVQMGIEVAEFLTNYFTIEGEDVFAKLKDTDYSLNSNVDFGGEVPLLGKIDLTLFHEKVGDFAGVKVSASGNQINLFDLFCMGDKDKLMLSSKLGNERSSAIADLPKMGEVDEEVLMRTAVILFGCMDEKWFFQDENKKYVILGTKEISTLANDFKTKAMEDETYMALLKDRMGEEERDAFFDYLGAVPGLLRSLPFAELRIDSLSSEGKPVGLLIKFKVPNYADVSLELSKRISFKNEVYTTTYDIQAYGDVVRYFKGGATVFAEFKCVKNETNVSLNVSAQDYELALSGNVALNETGENIYSGKGAVNVSQNEIEYLPITFSLNLNTKPTQYTLLPEFEQNLSSAQKSSSIPGLIADFLAGVRLNEIIFALSAMG